MVRIDMERQEVLVHISAASAFHDDKRYATLAAQLAAFEIAAVTHVYGRDPSLEHTTSSCISIQSSASPGLSATSLETSTHQRRSRLAPASAFSRSSKSPGARTSPSWNSPNLQAAIVHPRHLRPPRANHPYENPFGTPGFARRCATHDFQTTETSRPTTAQTGGPSNLQVPRTGLGPRKRAHSESSSFGSLISTISESQPFVGIENNSPVRSSPRDADMSTADVPASATTSEPSNYHVHLKTPARKRRRLTGLNAVGNKISSICNVPRPENVDGAFFLPDRSPDWTSPAEASASEPSQSTLSSTLSPSQPLPLRLSQSRTSPITRSPSLVIDLTSQVSKRTYRGKDQAASKNISLSSSSGTKYLKAMAIVSQDNGEDPPSSKQSSHPAATLARLPAHIEPPQPPATLGPFVTHVTENLSAIVQRLPLEKWFRPVEVTRDIANLERGHWSMHVYISREEDVATARNKVPALGRIDARRGKVTGATASERLRNFRQLQTASAAAIGLEPKASTKQYALWTEQEMEQFWENLSHFVGDGNAGWGIRVARDWGEEAVNPDRSTQIMYARIRIFTWGEVVGHVWLALWVLSDKKTSFVPMVWVARNDQVVVRMSGNCRRGRHLGPWRRTGPQGEKGAWGIGTEAS